MTADPFAALNRACVKAFGTAVSYKQGTATPFTVRGIVMRGSDEERHIDGLYARLFVDLADFATAPDHGDQATIGGATYTVFEVLADGFGGAHLSLREIV